MLYGIEKYVLAIHNHRSNDWKSEISSWQRGGHDLMPDVRLFGEKNSTAR